MEVPIPFTSELEYEQCLAWISEGSCLAQRMADAPGAVPLEIPSHWEDLKWFAENINGYEIPKSLEEYTKRRVDAFNAPDDED